MFASLKNKIREETGSDLSKLTAKITSSTTQRFEAIRGRSQHGSTSSVNSILSSEGNKDESSEGGRQEDDNRKRRLESELAARNFEEKTREWQLIIDEKDKKIQEIEKEKEDANKLIGTLQESLKYAEAMQKKLIEHRDDIEQVENFQIQELTKVKQLVLLREQELAERNSLLKETTSQVDKMRNELTRLRRQEERLSDIQDDLESLRHSSARDLASLATQLAKREEEKRHLTDLVAVLRQRSTSDSTDTDQASQERKLLEHRLEEAHLHLADIKTSWSDKITSLETQVGRLSRQAAEESAERRRAVQEKEELEEKFKQLECELECNRLELNNKESKIKRLTSEIEDLAKELRNLRTESDEEVTILKRQIQDSNVEIKVVRKNLDNSESLLDKSEDECSKLRLSAESEHQANISLKQIITKLEKELGEEKFNSLNVQKTLTRVTAEKNSTLLRNAEISQQMEMSKRDMRQQEMEMSELSTKISLLEEENKRYKSKENKTVEQELKGTISNLEDQLIDKNKIIKTLQLRLADMKKTLQQELRTTGNTNIYNDLTDPTCVAILAPSQTSTKNLQNTIRKDEDDVNSKYLKHVLIKFLTSREYEAQHLIRAVSTLLKFSPEEEKLLHETLEWKMSWFGVFGSKPKGSGNGQKATNIPPS